MVPGYVGGQGRTGTSESIRSKPAVQTAVGPNDRGNLCQSRTHTMAYTMVNRREGQGKGVLPSLMNGARKRKHTKSVSLTFDSVRGERRNAEDEDRRIHRPAIAVVVLAVHVPLGLREGLH